MNEVKFRNAKPNGDQESVTDIEDGVLTYGTEDNDGFKPRSSPRIEFQSICLWEDDMFQTVMDQSNRQPDQTFRNLRASKSVSYFL